MTVDCDVLMFVLCFLSGLSVSPVIIENLVAVEVSRGRYLPGVLINGAVRFCLGCLCLDRGFQG